MFDKEQSERAKRLAQLAELGSPTYEYYDSSEWLSICTTELPTTLLGILALHCGETGLRIPQPVNEQLFRIAFAGMKAARGGLRHQDT